MFNTSFLENLIFILEKDFVIWQKHSLGEKLALHSLKKIFQKLVYYFFYTKSFFEDRHFMSGRICSTKNEFFPSKVIQLYLKQKRKRKKNRTWVNRSWNIGSKVSFFLPTFFAITLSKSKKWLTSLLRNNLLYLKSHLDILSTFPLDV